MSTVKSLAVASIGNFSVGFDVLGVALDVLEGEPLGDVVEISPSDNGEHQFYSDGKFADYLPADINDNLVWQCMQEFESLCDLEPVKIVLHKHLPISSGLGSSASSIVAAAAGLNAYLGAPLTEMELLQLCGRLEGGISGSVHLDNVAPSLLGGIVLCNGAVTKRLPFNPAWRLVVAYSGQEVSTRKMREVLPQAYPSTEVIQQMTALGSFVNALNNKDWNLAAASIVDHLAEPRRAPLINGFIEAKSKCLNLGALAVGISGSGPTLFALCEADKAAGIAQWLGQNYVFNAQAFTKICSIRKQPVSIDSF